MSLPDSLTLITSTFATAWTATPVAWQNVSFDMKSNPEFVRFNVLFTKEDQRTMGLTNNLFRQHGLISMPIFTPLNRGAKRALELAEQFTAIWRVKMIQGHIFDTPNTVIIGNVDGVYQVNVNISFYTDNFY